MTKGRLILCAVIAGLCAACQPGLNERAIQDRRLALCTSQNEPGAFAAVYMGGSTPERVVVRREQWQASNPNIQAVITEWVALCLFEVMEYELVLSATDGVPAVEEKLNEKGEIVAAAVEAIPAQTQEHERDVNLTPRYQLAPRTAAQYARLFGETWVVVMLGLIAFGVLRLKA